MADGKNRNIQTGEQSFMTRLLASVNSLEEAKIALKNQVDIIDLKQPEKGALGALDCKTISEIVAYVDGQRPVSATIGDLPMHPEKIVQAVNNTVQTGVDFVKIGFFPGGKRLETINILSGFCNQKQQLIAVLFADQQPDLSFIPIIKRAGFNGVMLDTMNKRNGSLTQVLSIHQIKEFVNIAKNQKLLCGLAGSLQLLDIPRLLDLKPDYLGFRGAICRQKNRTESINETALQTIYTAIIESQPTNKFLSESS